MKIYLAGPMSGIAEHNFPLFNQTAKNLRSLDYDVINPAEINHHRPGQWLECMRADIAELIYCDGIYLLPGWERSKGASLEHRIAVELGLIVMMAPI